MKEATGEVSMTVIVIVAVAVIGGILALMWPKIKGTINDSFGNTGEAACNNSGGTWSCSKDANGNESCSCSGIK